MLKPDFLLVDLRDFFTDSGSGRKKSSENDQSFSSHCQSFFSFSELFLISPGQTVKLVIVKETSSRY